MRCLALTLLLAIACTEAEAPTPEPAPTDDVRKLINAGQYAEALHELDALGTERVEPAVAREHMVLRAWAEAGLGDCRLAADLAQTPLPGMSEGEHARLIGRAADLAVVGLSGPSRWTVPTPAEERDWDERVAAATCVLDAAVVRFPEDAPRIEARREQLIARSWAPAPARVSLTDAQIAELMRGVPCPPWAYR